jgi:ribosomal protein L24
MILKKGMKVKVCVGKDKGKSGEIIEINRVRNLAKVKAVNMVKKHKKPTKENKGWNYIKRSIYSFIKSEKFNRK